MGRHGNTNVREAFEEFQEDDNPTKCNKVRCKYCGYSRAKNTTRQLQHLTECQAYLKSADYTADSSPQTTRADGTESQLDSNMSPPVANTPGQTQKRILLGQRPNPMLQVKKRGPSKRTRDGQVKLPTVPRGPPPATAPAVQSQAPSMVMNLLSRDPNGVAAATNHRFLTQAGSGSLSADAVCSWLAQDAHISRSYVNFVGQLIGKTKLPVTTQPKQHPLYRTMEFLISALNNVMRELSFLEIIPAKYGLQLPAAEPTHTTKAYLDLFAASSAPSASLLEGLVVLWATQHCYRASWSYASLSSPTSDNPFSSYSITADPHNAALHQALIPNWTSPAFGKFVDACRDIVDQLANAQTSGNGHEEMARCVGAYKQVLWLWGQSWPNVHNRDEEAATLQAEEARAAMRRSAMSGDGIRPQTAGADTSDGDADAANEDDVLEP